MERKPGERGEPKDGEGVGEGGRGSAKMWDISLLCRHTRGLWEM